MSILLILNILSIHHRNIQTLAIEIFKFLNGLSAQIMNHVFQDDLRNKNELYCRNLRTEAYGTDSVCLWYLKSGQQCHLISIFFQKRHKEMETKLSLSVMQNLLATCWFYIIIMRGTGMITFFLSITCYIIDVFSFSFIFFPNF